MLLLSPFISPLFSHHALTFPSVAIMYGFSRYIVSQVDILPREHTRNCRVRVFQMHVSGGEVGDTMNYHKPENPLPSVRARPPARFIIRQFL